MFGPAGVAEVVRRHCDRPMSELLARLLEAVRDFCGTEPQADDITIVLIGRQGGTVADTMVRRYFKRSYDSLAAIFQFIEDFLAGRSIDASLREPVCFIVEELFTNMVKYNPEAVRDIALSLGRDRCGADRPPDGFRRAALRRDARPGRRHHPATRRSARSAGSACT